jgi:hypothetical protein
MCRKCGKANVKFCDVHTHSDIEIENIIIGLYKLPDHITQNGFFFGLKSSSYKGADSGKKIKNQS